MEYLHVSIEINGVKLEVIGNYWPGEAESLDSPGESESIEIEEILTESGDDIGGMVDSFESLQGYVEEAAMEAHIGRKELQREESAICAAKWPRRKNENLRPARHYRRRHRDGYHGLSCCGLLVTAWRARYLPHRPADGRNPDLCMEWQ